MNEMNGNNGDHLADADPLVADLAHGSVGKLQPAEGNVTLVMVMKDGALDPSIVRVAGIVDKVLR